MDSIRERLAHAREETLRRLAPVGDGRLEARPTARTCIRCASARRDR